MSDKFLNSESYRLSQHYRIQPDMHSHSKVWAVGGGKGGVGKSLVSANLSICLAYMGHKVIAVDLDLGGANLHTCLGLPIPEKTLSDYVSKNVTSLDDIITPTSIQNLSLISGAQDDLGMANLKNLQKARILSKLNNLDADFIILDLGAGTNLNTLDFFISSGNGILTVLPEPTSIENTYRFIKSVFHRRLKLTEELLDIRPLIDQVLNAKIGTEEISPAELLERVAELDKVKGEKLRAEIAKFRPKLIINQVRSQTDIDIGFSMKIICKKYFGIDLDYIGYLDYDPAVWQSVKRRKALMVEYPNSRLVTNIDKITKRLLGN